MNNRSIYILPAINEDDISDAQYIEQMADGIFSEGKLGNTPTTMDRSLQSELIGDGTLWLAKAETQTVGFIACKAKGVYLHLLQVSVLPKHMNLGIGKLLVQQSIAYATKHGKQEILLTCFRDIDWNMRFYQRMGFKAVSEINAYPMLKQALLDEKSAGLENRIAMHMKTKEL